MMSIYLSRSFPRSNSSFFLCSGNALQSEVLRLREEMFLVNAGLGTPRICMQDELTGVPINRATRFENKVGSMGLLASESLIKEHILKRFFIDLLAGESMIKERAATRFNDLVGSTDVVAGEPLLLLPRRFRKNRAWMELNKIWRTNTKVKGFIINKVKRGYSVAIAGFITFLPFRRLIRKRILNARFTIKSINPKRKRKKIVVLLEKKIKEELYERFRQAQKKKKKKRSPTATKNLTELFKMWVIKPLVCRSGLRIGGPLVSRRLSEKEQVSASLCVPFWGLLILNVWTLATVQQP